MQSEFFLGAATLVLSRSPAEKYLDIHMHDTCRREKLYAAAAEKNLLKGHCQ